MPARFSDARIGCNRPVNSRVIRSETFPNGAPEARLMMETTMFRKLGLVAVVAALSGAALAPTPAAAWYGGYHHGWWGPRVYFGAPVSYGYGNCYVRELVRT